MYVYSSSRQGTTLQESSITITTRCMQTTNSMFKETGSWVYTNGSSDSGFSIITQVALLRKMKILTAVTSRVPSHRPQLLLKFLHGRIWYGGSGTVTTYSSSYIYFYNWFSNGLISGDTSRSMLSEPLVIAIVQAGLIIGVRTTVHMLKLQLKLW